MSSFLLNEVSSHPSNEVPPGRHAVCSQTPLHQIASSSDFSSNSIHPSNLSENSASLSIRCGYCPTVNQSLTIFPSPPWPQSMPELQRNGTKNSSIDVPHSSTDFDDFDVFDEICRDIQDSSNPQSHQNHLNTRSIFQKTIFWIVTGTIYTLAIFSIASLLAGCSRDSEHIQNLSTIPPQSLLISHSKNPAYSPETRQPNTPWRRWFIDNIEDHLATIIEEHSSETWIVDTSQLPPNALEGDYFLVSDIVHQWPEFQITSSDGYSNYFYTSIAPKFIVPQNIHSTPAISPIQLPDCTIQLCFLDEEYKASISMRIAEKRYHLTRSDVGEDISL